jgi:antitoxin component of RelBE/YafQ-DinJ toxin-antitoxin module
MNRNAALNVRVTTAERQLAEAVAERLERTESDMVRLLLREKARELGIIPAAKEQRQPQRAGVHA